VSLVRQSSRPSSTFGPLPPYARPPQHTTTRVASSSQVCTYRLVMSPSVGPNGQTTEDGSVPHEERPAVALAAPSASSVIPTSPTKQRPVPSLNISHPQQSPPAHMQQSPTVPLPTSPSSSPATTIASGPSRRSKPPTLSLASSTAGVTLRRPHDSSVAWGGSMRSLDKGGTIRGSVSTATGVTSILSGTKGDEDDPLPLNRFSLYETKSSVKTASVETSRTQPDLPLGSRRYYIVGSNQSSPHSNRVLKTLLDSWPS
jgi:hypothetical protein